MTAAAIRHATVTIVGAGQAGLSAAFHLRRRGFVSAIEAPGGPRTFIVLDASSGPGGAWLHRWESLRMSTVNGIFALPGQPAPPFHPSEASRDAVPRYFADYESTQKLPILRPVTVVAVRPADADPAGLLLVETDADTWTSSAVINATGTWTAPFIPTVTGSDAFTGFQLHTHDYVDAERFAGQRVAVVGGGISAIQLLDEISSVADTFWYTRREPVFLDHPFDAARDGVAVEARVAADVAAGRRPGSVVSYTGLIWTDYARRAYARGALQRRAMFTALTETGVREADGSVNPVDSILWATGFQPALGHLEPLGLRGALGGIPLEGTRASFDHRVHLIGYGPSQSTVGANRAGRAAAASLDHALTTSPHF